MTVRELVAVLRGVDPNLKVHSEVTASNKSVRGAQVVTDSRRKPRVVLK